VERGVLVERDGSGGVGIAEDVAAAAAVMAAFEEGEGFRAGGGVAGTSGSVRLGGFSVSLIGFGHRVMFPNSHQMEWWVRE
jgi:hypothetical protein